VAEAKRPVPKPSGAIASGRDLNRYFSLLETSLKKIEQEHRDFYGTLKFELNFREGQIETVVIERRQTFKY
jgi:hypothetical protein